MVPILDYNTFWNHIVEICNLDLFFLVSEESEMSSYIKEVEDDCMILVAVIPSSDTDAPDIDNIEEADSCVIFVMKKITPSNLTAAEILQVRQDTQAAITSVKNEMIKHAADVNNDDAGTKLMRRLVIDKMHTDPEYNYLGCTGWSLSFLIKSVGIYHGII